VPAEPDAQCGQTHQFLEAVARSAGLDFLPREHKLPQEAFGLTDPANATLIAEPGLTLSGGAFSRGREARPHWALSE